MRVIPLAADSLGVRSMATYVEAGSLRLLLDPGARLSPRRFGLPPAPEEDEALARAVDRIEAYAVRAALVTVSHFHADHYRLEPRIYAGRRVWAKDPRRMTDPHQAGQGRAFWQAMVAHAAGRLSSAARASFNHAPSRGFMVAARAISVSVAARTSAMASSSS